MRKKAIFIMVLVVVALAIGYSGYEIWYGPRPVRPLRIGYLIADIHQAAFFISYDQGFYEAEGIRVKPFEYVHGPAQMEHFLAGELDAGYVGIVPAIIAKSRGADLVVIASANYEGSAIVARKDIKRVEDLHGKVVGTPGIGTIQDSMLSYVERKHGISTIHKYYRMPELPLALEKGEINAFIGWEPFPSEVIVKGIGHVIYTSHEILPNHQCCVLYVSGKLLRENRELALRLLKAHVKAMKFMKGSPDDAIKILAKTTGKHVEVIRESWKRIVWDYHPNIDSIKIFVRWLIEEKKVDPKAVLDINAFVNDLIDLTLLKELR